MSHFSGGESQRLDDIWSALRREVHELLCTSSAKYAKERSSFNATLKPAIAALAAFVTKDYGFPVAAASSLASLALLLPVRMVKDAWCSVLPTPDIERKELRKIIEENARAGSRV
jgi:hypothetical protein